MGRSKASILKKEWDDVEEGVKNKIWQSITLTYDVPNNDVLRRKWISFAGERWRAFKTYLTSNYIFGSSTDKSPCEEYQFLDEETWQRFVESRQDPTFLEKRRKGQEIQAKNLHPHKLSRGGYDLLEQQIIQEKVKQREEASQFDPSVVVSPPSPPTRHEKWKRARQKKSGEYLTEHTRIVAEKIDDLVDQSYQGSFIPVGRQNILTTAIGQPEHPGRVRTAGRGVGIRQYFGAPPSFGSSSEPFTKDQFKAFKETIIHEVRQELVCMGYSHGDPNVNPQPSRSPINVSTRGSCAPDDVPENDLLDPDEYELYVEDPLHVVAIGSIFNLGPTIHHKQIEDDKVRVVVERVREANARVPLPTEEVQTVSQAPNHFILWPRRLVKLVTTKETVEPEHDPFSRLCLVALRIGKMPIQLQLDPDVIGRPTPIPLYMSQRDMMDLAMGNEMVSLSTLQLWLMYLNRLCISKGIVDKYGFIDPLHIQSTGNKTKDIQSYIHSRICTVRKECYLTPYLHS